jgi:hypothetical protein
MTKKIVYQERIGNQFLGGEYLMWECGCSEIIFSDRGPSFNCKSCGSNHENRDALEKGCQTDSFTVSRKGRRNI